MYASRGVLLFLHLPAFFSPGKVYTIVRLVYFVYVEKYLTTEIPNRRHFEDYFLPECYAM
jgi:hypothetical protein